MRKMKNSGIEWIGEIPEDWKIIKLAHGIEFTGSGTTPPSDIEQWYHGEIPWITTSELKDSVIYDSVKHVSENALNHFSALKLYPTGSLVIAMYGATIGRMGFMGMNSTTNQACCVLFGEKKLLLKYIFYFFFSFRKEIIMLSQGAGQPNISQEIIRSLKISTPSISEQQQINSFLDEKCALIDRLVERHQEVIEKLKAYRQSVISEAVTRGLDPDAPMKDSGIPWIGKIPEGWKIQKLKILASISTQKGQFDKEKIYIGLENIEPWTGKYIENFDKTDIESNTTYFNSDSVLFGKLRPYLAKVFKPIENGQCSMELLALTPVNINRNFLFWNLLNIRFIDEINSSTFGAKMPRANWEFIGNCKLPLPPLINQSIIADYLDEKCAKIDRIIHDKEQIISKLAEYKKSIIYEYVTGKKEVPAS